MKKNESSNLTSSDILRDARRIIDTARNNAIRSVDYSRVQMYWNLGKRIFEEEQQGKDRADYGAYIVKSLAKELKKLLPISASVKTNSDRSYKKTPIPNLWSE